MGSRSRLTTDGMWLRRLLSPEQDTAKSLVTLLVDGTLDIDWMMSLVELGTMSKNVSVTRVVCPCVASAGGGQIFADF